MVLLDQKLAEPWGVTGQWMCGDLAGNAFQGAVDCDNQQN
jgi:hypothetical protein